MLSFFALFLLSIMPSPASTYYLYANNSFPRSPVLRNISYISRTPVLGYILISMAPNPDILPSSLSSYSSFIIPG